MPLKKDKKDFDVYNNHPVENIIAFAGQMNGKKEKPKKPKAEYKLKNFRIEKKLIEDFELLCKHRYADFTQVITDYIKNEVEECAEEIKYAKSKNL